MHDIVLRWQVCDVACCIMLCYVVASPDRVGVDVRSAVPGKPACIYQGVAVASIYGPIVLSSELNG